jgi:pimeloyl-ACP methyl ester carboxylesterase
VSDRRLNANGVAFAYLEQGSGPLVLLLHGFPETPHTFDRSMTALADAGFRCVAPFMRGYAPTEVPTDGAYDIDTLGRDALGLIAALGAEPAIVIGHDWGASATYAAAALGPDRVRFAVAIGVPHAAAIPRTPRMAWRLRHFATLRRSGAPARVRAHDFAFVDELYRRWSPAWRDIPASETAQVKEAFAAPGSVEAACGYYRALTVRLPPSHKLAISVPTVAFAGGDDDLFGRATYDRARRHFAGRYDVITTPGGHFMHRERPDTFVPELVRVVRQAVR